MTEDRIGVALLLLGLTATFARLHKYGHPCYRLAESLLCRLKDIAESILENLSTASNKLKSDPLKHKQLLQHSVFTPVVHPQHSPPKFVRAREGTRCISCRACAI